MDDGSDRVDVAPWRVSRQLGRLPEDCSGRVVGGELQRRVAEVGKYYVRVCRIACEAEEDVAGFDVTMANPSPIGIAAPGVEAPVQELEGRGQLLIRLPYERFR